MRILVVSNLYPPSIMGGYELGCRNVVAGLVARGHDVVVVTSPSHAREDDSADCDTGGAQLIRTLAVRSFGPEYTRKQVLKPVNHFEGMVSNYANTAIVLEAIRSHRPDCVYLFNLAGIGGLAIIDALNTIGMPWVFHLMDAVPAYLQQDVPSEALAVFNAHRGGLYSGGRLIAMSSSLVDEIEALTKFKFPVRPVIVPGWAKARPALRERSYFQSGQVRFVTAGQLWQHKGIGIIIQAMALLRAARIQNFSVDIYGNGSISEFVDLAKQLDVAEFISFHGHRRQEELLTVYDTADVFLFPTWPREPFGFAPVEAASAGCIPVVTRQAGVCEQLTDGVDCFMIEQNATDLAAIMRRFCVGQVDAAAMGRHARATTQTRLNFDTCLTKIEEVLSSSLQGRSQPRSPNWRELNLTLLKHNFAYRTYLQSVAREAAMALSRYAAGGAQPDGTPARSA